MSGCMAVTHDGLGHIGSMSGLQGLRLHGMPLTDESMTEISRLQDLEWLSIYADPGNIAAVQVSDAGVAQLGHLQNLTSLSLAGAAISNEVSSTLRGLASLERLSFYCTSVTPGGLFELCRAIPECKIEGTNYLEQEGHFDIGIAPGGSVVRINGDLADSDYEKLAQLMTLNELALPSSISDPILEIVSNIETLESLSLPHCRAITNAGIGHIAGINGLKKLNLWYCRGLDAGCVQHLATMTNLEELTLGGTKLDEAARNQLRTALPNCEIKH
ncbi:MAG: hypothetical protein ACR2NP_16730, partial [Pirellulaceae bacterium]